MDKLYADLAINKKILVYLPCYNCGEKVGQTLAEIPIGLHDLIECLVIDNCSTDQTEAMVRQRIDSHQDPFPVHYIKPDENLGYAGSQKLAYSMLRHFPNVKKIIMLHGDGQYPATMLEWYLPFFEQDHAFVNGFRSKKTFAEQEETPMIKFVIIKILSAIESTLLGIQQKEWHSGFVMYDAEFLKKVPLSQLSSTMHIDGEFIMCAHVLAEQTASIPIYKRYKNFQALAGKAIYKHIFDVFRLIFRYRKGYYHQILKR